MKPSKEVPRNDRVSTDQSPSSSVLNPTVKNPYPKLNTTSDKILIPSVLQAKYELATEDLKKAKEKLILLEKEKKAALSKVKELEKAHELSNEAYAKLKESLAAERRAEESSKIKECRGIESEQARIGTSRKEVENGDELIKKVEFLNNQLEIIKEEKRKLVDELEACRNKGEEKSKRVSEDLASALHEVSSQARDSKESLFAVQAENENYKMEIEDLKSVIKAKDDKYESVINALSNPIERSKHEYHELKAATEKKELYLMNALKRSEEEKSCMGFEISRLDNLLKTMKKEAESVKIREGLFDKDDKLKKNVSENDELRRRERDLLAQVEVLSNLIEQAFPNNNNNKQEEEYNSEKDYDVLPKWTSFIQMNEEHAEAYEVDMLNGKLINGEEKEEDEEEFSEGEIEMWDCLKVDEKDSYTEDDVTNGVVMKKKKPLLGKIGSLLKKGQ